jgi:hypothetical protein
MQLKVVAWAEHATFALMIVLGAAEQKTTTVTADYLEGICITPKLGR